MSFTDFIIKWKVRLGAAGGLFSMIGIPYLVAVQAQTQLEKANIVLPFVYILCFGLFALLIVGWSYDHYGLFSKENGYCFQRNTEWNKRHEKE